MWFSIAVLLIATVGTRAQIPPITSSTGCVCVRYNLCSAFNSTIIDDGSGLLGERVDIGVYEECACPSRANPRGQRCGDVMQVCCHLPDQTETAPPIDTSTTEEPEEVLSWDDCGTKGFDVLADTVDRVIASDDKSVTFSNEFPWMAMVLKKSDNSMLCGASILHHHVIMTAAHCVRRFQAPDLLVRVGVWNRNVVAGSDTVEVERIFSHPDFGPANYRNDIALLVLRRGLVRSYKVAPICLPEPSATFDNMVCTATGWGISVYGQRNFSDTLKKVDLRIVPHAQCQSELQTTRLGPWFKLHESFVCAKGGNSADTCVGDGGGPLVCQQTGSKEYLQVGIVAAGLECGNDIPALYANVPKLTPWVQQKFQEWNLKALQD